MPLVNGQVVTTYLKYVGRRKPELLDTASFSLTNYREAETVVADWRTLERQAEALGKALPAADKDAYYQLVLHPVQAMANLQDMYVTVARNRLYAMQGRAATNELRSVPSLGVVMNRYRTRIPKWLAHLLES